jgi:hypothetical protein
MTQAYEVGVSGPERTSSSGVNPSADRADERSVGAIVTDLWEKTETLVRQEMRLGIAEAEEKVDQLKGELDDRLKTLKLELAAKAIGGAVAIGGALALVAAVVLLLSEAMPPWLAALVTGVVFGGVGFALLKREVKLPSPPPAEELIPQRTVASIKADTQAIEEASHGTTNS